MWKIIYFCVSWFCISISSKKCRKSLHDISEQPTVRNTGIIRVLPFFFFLMNFRVSEKKCFNPNFIDTSLFIGSSSLALSSVFTYVIYERFFLQFCLLEESEHVAKIACIFYILYRKKEFSILKTSSKKWHTFFSQING